jgi:trehalose 2-sulfotransferase
MKPTLSYTIWFTQRTGSTLLYLALESTGVAGVPKEWLQQMEPEATGIKEIEQMWKEGTSPNGVFGLKDSMQFAHNDKWISSFKKAFRLPDDLSRPQVWEAAFPGSKYIFMTRRNKVRLAVSWWRAIVSGEWHRSHGYKPTVEDISDKYSFDAINHLLMESVLREAAIEEFIAEGGITPLTIVYEDFIQNYEATVLEVLTYLGIQTEGVQVAPPKLDQIADDIAEQWVQRFREERQADWDKRAW